MAPPRSRTPSPAAPAPLPGWQGAGQRAWESRAVWGTRLLALSPVVFLPFALNRFGWLALATAVLGATLVLSDATLPRLARPVAIALGVVGAVALVAALAGEAPMASLLGRAPRYEGLLVVGGYVLCFVAGTKVLGSEGSEGSEGSQGSQGKHGAPGSGARHALAEVLAGAVCAAALVAALAAVGLDLLPTDASRSGGLLGNATALGLLGAVALPVLAQAAHGAAGGAADSAVAGATAGVLRDRRTLLLLAGTIAAPACVLLSQSRGALLALVIGAVVLAVGVAPLRRWLLGGLALVAVVALVLPGIRDRLLGASPWSGQTVRGRGELWQQALAIVGEHPVLGVGPSGFASAAVPHRTAEFYLRFGVDAPADSPHNVVLQVAVATGVLGLLAVLGLAIVVGREAVRGLRASATPETAVRWAFLAAAAAYGTGLLTYFTSPDLTPLAAFLAGGLCTTVPAAAPTPKPAPTLKPTPAPVSPHLRTGAVTAGALVTVVAGISALAEIPLKAATDHVLAGDLDAADAAYEQAAQLRPWDPAISAAAVHAYLAAATVRPESATTAGNAAAPWVRDVDTRVESAGLDVLRWEAQFDDADAALARADRMRRMDPHNPELLLHAAILRAEREEYDEAERLLLRATEIAPHSPDPWRNLAVLYGLTDEPSKAERATAEADERS